MDVDIIVNILDEYGIYDEHDPVDSPDIGTIKPDQIVKKVPYEYFFSKPYSELDQLRPPLSDGDFRPKPSEELQIALEENLYLEGNLKRSMIEDLIEETKFKSAAWDPKNHKPCAWYLNAHIHRHRMGIYILNKCIERKAKEISLFLPGALTAPHSVLISQLYSAAFLHYFLHEQFHHKVESFGFRALVSSGSDKYLNYKTNVYWRHYGTDDCLEEALANAQIIRRLNEKKYKTDLLPEIKFALENCEKTLMPYSKPGYRRGTHYFEKKAFQDGLHDLQSQIIDGMMPAVTPPTHWQIAPQMSHAKFNIAARIYLIL